MKQQILNNLKNIPGWRTGRKLVVFAVDDYGNVRLDSKQARENLDKAGLKVHSRFDAYDTLETRQDLEALFEVLSSVEDSHGRNAVFTTYALPCNIDFETMAKSGYTEFHNEPLTQTFEKLESLQPDAYRGAWSLWQEGIEKRFLAPQFHGREHLNLKLLEEKLGAKDFEVLTALKNRSYTSITNNYYDTISFTAAFDFWTFEENDRFSEIIRDGLDAFERVFGYRAKNFTPPGGREHPVIHKTLKENEIKFIDTPLIKKEHQGKGKYKTRFNFTGKQNNLGQYFIVRNVVFEPTHDRGFEWGEYALDQIAAAFRWRRPAIISSHRVNFCGHIDENNRQKGLEALKRLLQEIVMRWPEVEFITANDLGDLIAGDRFPADIADERRKTKTPSFFNNKTSQNQRQSAKSAEEQLP